MIQYNLNINALTRLSLLSTTLSLLFLVASSVNIKAEQTNKVNNNILLLHFTSTRGCKVVKFIKQPVSKADSLCYDMPSKYDNFTTFYPLKRVFYIDNILKIDSTSQLLFWHDYFVKQIYFLPWKYLQFNFKKLRSDSIITITIRNKNYLLRPNQSMSHTFISYKKERNRIIKYSDTITLTNVGLINRENVYNRSNWEENKVKYDLDAQLEPYSTPDIYPQVQINFLDYIYTQLRANQSLENIKISGKIVIKAVVNIKGQITHARIVRGINPLIDKASLEAVTNMPAWIPAKNNGKVVEAEVNLSFEYPYKN
jgi:hypothetical protein